MTFESAIRDSNPEALAGHLLAGADVIYFTLENLPGELKTMYAVVHTEKGDDRPATLIRNEAMRLYDAGLCNLFQRRSEWNIGSTRVVTVDYVAATRRRARAC